jgi:hypothetical protein
MENCRGVIGIGRARLIKLTRQFFEILDQLSFTHSGKNLVKKHQLKNLLNTAENNATGGASLTVEAKTLHEAKTLKCMFKREICSKTSCFSTLEAQVDC